ncbi:MAG: FAD-dependent oxidoreductase, partial [Bacteroidota bacterium]
GRYAGFMLLGAPGADAGSSVTSERVRALRLWNFTRENAEAVRSLASDPSGDTFGLRWTGSVVAAGSTAEASMLERQAEVLDDVEWLAPDALHRRLGDARGFLGGLLVRTGGVLDPARLVRSLALRSGATVLERSAVGTLEADGSRVRLTGASGALRAERVVLCLGAYLPHLVPGLEAFVRPVRAQMLATEPLAPALYVPVYSHDGYNNLRQRRDGRVLVGGARHLHEATEVGYDDETTDALQGHLEAYLGVHFPGLGTPEVERRWSGTMGFSPDGLPVVGDVPNVPGAHFATGFTGHGMGYCLRFGKLLARRVLGQSDPDADLFDAARLAPSPHPNGHPSPVTA